MHDSTPPTPISGVVLHRYLSFEISQLPTVDEYQHLLTKMANAARENNIPRALLDASTIPSLFNSSDARLFAHVLGTIMQRHFRLAILVQQYFPGHHRAETIATSHMVQLKYFTDPDEAHTWLQRGSLRR
jgi:hypothetical protein